MVMTPTPRVEYFARVFVSSSGSSGMPDTGTNSRGGRGGKGVEVLKVCPDDIQLYLCTPEEWRGPSRAGERDVTRWGDREKRRGGLHVS